VPGKTGNLTWLLNASVMQHRQRSESESHDVDTHAGGAVAREQLIASSGDNRSKALMLSPRLQYKFANNDTLTFQPFVVVNRGSGGSDTFVDQLAGSMAPEFAYQRTGTTSSSSFVRGFGNWLHRMDGGARLEVKFGGGGGRNDSESLRNTFDADGGLLRAYHDTDSNRSHNLTTGGKYTRPLGQGHLLAAGWDAEAGHLEQVHVAEDDGSPLFDDSGASLAADTRRVALFVQDEWDITAQWSAYLGLRWEGIRTTSTSSGQAVANTSSVWSPVLHTVWRIPGHDKDQLRASVTQSYRAPQLNDLIAAPYFATNNTATRPDRTGNPNLKPELAKGLDLAYEHYLGKSGILSASVFARQIDKLMRRTVSQYTNSRGEVRWVSTPTNIGTASTSGIELEAKFALAELVASAPNVDLRANYSRFWSKVEGIPGPDNRLDQQAKQTANLGLDYRMKALPLTLGASYNWTPETVVQTSLAENVFTDTKRQVDAYGLWKLSAMSQLRLSAANLSPREYVTARTVAAPGLTTGSSTSTRTWTTVGVRFETKL
jgi:iron complex outermembrane receptor protein